MATAKNCRSFLRIAISFLSGLSALVYLIIPALLLRTLVFRPAFSTETLVPHDQPVPPPSATRPFYMSWQEPLTYEALVYTSTQATVSANFFANSQLVWHSGPQTLQDTRFPILGSSRVPVTIPESILNDRFKSSALYIHVFAQQMQAEEVSEDGTHVQPNTNDPYLLHSVTPLVKWEQQAGSALSISTLAANKNTAPQLKMAKSVTWAISLENHVYRSFEMLPAHIAKYLQQGTPAAQELLKQRLYNPPFAVNSFTQSIPRTKVLPAKKASKKGSGTPVYESSIEVDLEIRGIRDGWMRTKSMLLNPIDPAKHTPKPGDKTSIMLFALFTILYSYISVLGVPTLVSAFACMMLIVSIACLSFGARVFYWLSPRSRWMGYSRTSFVISLAAICFASLSSISTKLSLLPAVLPSVVISAVLFIIMTKAPLNPLLWWATVRKFMQELPDSTELDDAGTYRRIIALNETSDQQSSDSNRSTLDIPTPPATPGNGTTEEELEAQPTESPKDPRAERITAARKHVDRLVLQWTPKIAIALFSLVLLYSMIAPRTPVESQVLGRIGYFLLNCAVVLQWVQWVPQVMINHRARAGNLVPVAVNAAHLAVTLIILVAASMVRVDIPTSRIFKEILPQVMNLIIVAQWAMYYWSD